MTAQTSPRLAQTADPTPFWERIPRFFLFPLQPAILGHLCLTAALPALCFLAPGAISGLLLFFGGSLWAWFSVLRLGSRIAIETSRGRLQPGDYADNSHEGLGLLPFSIFALFFVSGLLVGLIQGMFGNTPAMAMNFVVSLLLPAALMVLLHSRSLLAGLNPWRAATLIGSVGKPYLLLCVFLFCLSSAQMFLTWQLYAFGLKPIIGELMAGNIVMEDGQSPIDLIAGLFAQQRGRMASALFCANLAAMFFTMIAFNMLGYVLYQYHRILGIPLAPAARNGSPAPTEDDGPAAQIAELIAAGEINRAIDIAYEEQRVHHEDVAAQERYHKLLHLAGRKDRLLPHANRLIPLLLQRQMASRAIAAWRRCHELDADFRLHEPAIELALAEAAHKLRENQLALDLMRAFDKRHPRHPLIPEVYFLSARILCEEFRQDAMAEKIFTTIATRYPQHPCAAQATEYRRTLSRLRQSAKPA